MIRDSKTEWKADGTLASSPGPSYTRNYVYDEEGRLVSISHGSTVAFQYGYAYDGGRRWRKDIANAIWTWYPCGVACSAGELVEQTSDLTGNTWTNSATYLRGSSCSGGLIRRNSEYHHEDITGNFGAITNGSGSVISSNLYDSFGVQRFTTELLQPNIDLRLDITKLKDCWQSAGHLLIEIYNSLLNNAGRD